MRKLLVLSSTVVTITLSAQAHRIDDSALKTVAGDDWLSYGLTQSETRFSPLKDINTTNVRRLGAVWAYDVGSGGGGQEATPLVWNGTIYGITNWSVVFAVDARTGKPRWRWDPEVNQTTVRAKICCGVVNRGIALYNGMIIAPAVDGRLFALDADTGKPVWEARVAYPQDHYTVTMAPRIAKGKVVIGASGGDRPTRGFFAAYDAMTGRPAWRFYTVPGDPSKPFESAAMKKAAATWDGEWWKLGGGGAVWDGFAYDPDADLIYVGTGNAEPWAQALRTATPKDNLYVCSILADMTIAGRVRKVIMQANKNGFFYVIDRLTGEFISAGPFSRVTWAKGIDPKTGRPIVNTQALYTTDAISISPGGGGAHNWSPMSFNPLSGLMYIPTSTANSWTYQAEVTYNPRAGMMTGTTRPMPAATVPSPPAIGPEPLGDSGPRGALVAWDPVAQQMRWRQPGGGGIGGGTLTTAGNLVFQVVNDGRLLAYTADKGEKLADIQTGLKSGMGPPITYRLDGKQYVALMGGVGAAAPGGNAGPGNQPTPFSPKLITFAVDGSLVLTSQTAQ